MPFTHSVRTAVGKNQFLWFIFIFNAFYIFCIYFSLTLVPAQFLFTPSCIYSVCYRCFAVSSFPLFILSHDHFFLPVFSLSLFLFSHRFPLSGTFLISAERFPKSLSRSPRDVSQNICPFSLFTCPAKTPVYPDIRPVSMEVANPRFWPGDRSSLSLSSSSAFSYFPFLSLQLFSVSPRLMLPAIYLLHLACERPLLSSISREGAL